MIIKCIASLCDSSQLLIRNPCTRHPGLDSHVFVPRKYKHSSAGNPPCYLYMILLIETLTTATRLLRMYGIAVCKLHILCNVMSVDIWILIYYCNLRRKGLYNNNSCVVTVDYEVSALENNLTKYYQLVICIIVW